MRKFLLVTIAFLSVFLLNCNTKRQGTSDNNIPKEVISNGTKIDYSICGEGDLTLFFVHGWCINKTYWSQQVDEFCKKYKVVTIDLPGFGQSGKERAEWTMQSYGDDVNNVIKALKLHNVILIGHSMAGDIVLEAALNNDDVVALVGVDNFKDLGAEYDEQTQAQIDEFMAMLKQNFSEVAPAYAEGSLFQPTTDSLIRARVMCDFAQSDSLAAIGSLEALLNYGSREMENLTKLKQKLYLINSDATPTNTAALDSAEVRFEVADIHATGHYPMIEKPQDFNKLLEGIVQGVETDLKQ